MTEATSEPRASAPSPSLPSMSRAACCCVEAGAYASLALIRESWSVLGSTTAPVACAPSWSTAACASKPASIRWPGLTPRGLSGLDTQARVLLRLGAYQLLHTRVSPVRAVNQVVTTLRSCAARGWPVLPMRCCAAWFAKVLRPYPPAPDASPAAVAAALAQQHGLPPFLLAELLPPRTRWSHRAVRRLDTPPRPGCA